MRKGASSERSFCYLAGFCLPLFGSEAPLSPGAGAEPVGSAAAAPGAPPPLARLSRDGLSREDDVTRPPPLRPGFFSGIVPRASGARAAREAAREAATEPPKGCILRQAQWRRLSPAVSPGGPGFSSQCRARGSQRRRRQRKAAAPSPPAAPHSPKPFLHPNPFPQGSFCPP